MDGKKQFSIIVPAYNVQKYLGQCINSLLAQSYTKLEIILVDDGSTDNTGRICDQFAEKDARIRVIHKTNGGLSSARNVGIGASTGDYIAFLDGDDFWDDPEAASLAVHRLDQRESDVLNFSYVKYYEDTEKKIPYFDRKTDMPADLRKKEEQYAFLSKKGLYIASACNKWVKRDIITANKLYFREGITSEDIDWCARLLCAAGSMDFINEAFYCYRQREGSISHTYSIKKCEDLCQNIEECLAITKMADSITRDTLLRYTAYQYGTFFAVQARAAGNPEKCIERLSQYSWLLKHHGGNRKLRVLQILCTLFGFKHTCRLLRLIYGRHY